MALLLSIRFPVTYLKILILLKLIKKSFLTSRYDNTCTLRCIQVLFVSKCLIYCIVMQLYLLIIQCRVHHPAMAFGSGMIDVITISKLAATVYAVYKDAPVDYKPVAEEVNLLWGIISGAAKHFESTTLSGTTLSDNDRQEGQKVLKCCQNVLEDLNSLIEKYNSFAFTNTNQGFYRVELRTHDISALRARLASTTTLLCSFIQRFDISMITIL